MQQQTKPPPLDEQDVIGLVQQLVSDIQFVERNAEFAARRALVYGQRKVSIPGLINLQTQYAWPRLRKDANRFKNTMLAAPLTYTVAANADGPRSMQQAQDMQNFARRHYVRWKESGCFDGALFDMAAIGYGVLHQYINRDVLPIMPDYDDDTDPEAWVTNNAKLLEQFSSGERSDLLCVESVLPETVYWTPDMGVRLQAARVPINVFAAMYEGLELEPNDEGGVDVITTTSGGTAIDSGRLVSNHTATVYIVEDDHYIYHAVFSAQTVMASGGIQLDGGTVVGTHMNPFGRASFHIIDGERTGDPHALRRSLPLIDGLYEVGPLINIMGTLIESSGIETAQQQQTLEELPGPEAEAARAKGGPLQVVTLNDKFVLPPAGYRIVPSQIKLPNDVLVAYQTMQKEADMYGYPTSLSQPQEIQATSGYDRAKAQDAVTSLMGPPLEHFGDVCDALFKGCFTAVKSIGIPVSVRNLTPTSQLGQISGEVARVITVKPDDVIDVDSSVEFDSTTSYARIANQEEGLKMMAADAMYKDEFLADVRGIDDVPRYYRGANISKMRAVADAAAVQDATMAFQKIREFAQQQAIQAAQLKPAVSDIATQAMALGQEPPPPGAPPGQPMGEVNASFPNNPGGAQPIMPAPPQGGLT